MLENKINNQYEVLTPDGWSVFSGIKRKLSSNLLKVVFDDGSDITCTKDHLFEVEDHTFIHANFIKSGDVISKKLVKEIKQTNETQYVYDLINVDKWDRYYTNEIVSHNCTFLGSAGTLISAGALGNLVFGRPLRSIMEGLDVYDEPEPNHFYISTVDTARGVGLDYSAFVIVDVTAQPFKVVAKYRSNVVSPLLFPNIIVQAAKYYHDAYLLIENNDIGSQIAMVVHNELEYENMFHGEESGNIKYRMNGRFNLSQFGKTKQLGVKTTKKVKRQGCNTLKDLIENQRLLIPDFNIIEELSTFVLLSSGYYGAEEGSHDDLAMCLVLFSWLTTQPYFKDMTNFDIRKKLYDEKMQQMEDELPPIPLMSSGFETDNGQKYFKDGGLMWENIGESNSDFNSYANDFFKYN
jgi:hypothetical protein